MLRDRIRGRILLLTRIFPFAWSFADALVIFWSLVAHKVLGKNRGYSANFKLKGQKVAFHYPSASELYTLVQIFGNDIYSSSQKDPKLIIDLGANVGLASLYYLLSYPAASLTAYEPDPVTSQYTRKNLAPFKNAHVIEKAVAASAGTLEFYRNERSCASSIYPDAETVEKVSVEATTLDEVLVDTADILKVDVEGAETEIFPTSQKLYSVGELIAECDGKDKEKIRSFLEQRFAVTERSGIFHAIPKA